MTKKIVLGHGPTLSLARPGSQELQVSSKKTGACETRPGYFHNLKPPVLGYGISVSVDPWLQGNEVNLPYQIVDDGFGNSLHGADGAHGMTCSFQ
ncbi:MAG: hypothetical protein ACKVP5_08900, partial [Aestuariivirga sp.]